MDRVPNFGNFFVFLRGVCVASLKSSSQIAIRKYKNNLKVENTCYNKV